MPRMIAALCLEVGDRQQIEKWLAAHGTPQQVALRGRIVRAAAEGQSDTAIAAQLQINRKTVILWRRRFAEAGLESLWEIAPGRGRKPVYGADKIKALVDTTLQTKPKGVTQWSCRLMATRATSASVTCTSTSGLRAPNRRFTLNVGSVRSRIAPMRSA